MSNSAEWFSDLLSQGNKEIADITFNDGEKTYTYPVPRSILNHRAREFEDARHNSRDDTARTGKNAKYLNGITHAALRIFLFWVYCGRLPARVQRNKNDKDEKRVRPWLEACILASKFYVEDFLDQLMQRKLTKLDYTQDDIEYLYLNVHDNMFRERDLTVLADLALLRWARDEGMRSVDQLWLGVDEIERKVGRKIRADILYAMYVYCWDHLTGEGMLEVLRDKEKWDKLGPYRGEAARLKALAEGFTAEEEDEAIAKVAREDVQRELARSGKAKES